MSDTGETQQHGEDADDSELQGMAYQPSVNQVRREPVPASHAEDKDQDAVRQNEEHWRRSAGESGSAGAVPGKSAGKQKNRKT